MRKLIAFFFAITFLNVSIAVTPAADGEKKLNANAIMLPVGKTGQKISLMDFSKLKPAEYEQLAHVKLNFFDRIAYKLAMKKLRKNIAADGTIKSKKMKKAFSSKTDEFTEDFHLGGLALGFLLGLIGVLIAYLIEDDNKPSRVKWAWLGCAAWVAIVLIAVVL